VDDSEEDHESVQVDPLQAFIESYIQRERITPGYRWPEHKIICLQNAAAQCNPPLKDTVDALKKKIMATVNM
jgi:hypothetical protein